MVSKMADLRERLAAADGPRPDILAKKSQSAQFKVSHSMRFVCCFKLWHIGEHKSPLSLSVQDFDSLHLR